MAIFTRQDLLVVAVIGSIAVVVTAATGASLKVDCENNVVLNGPPGGKIVSRHDFITFFFAVVLAQAGSRKEKCAQGVHVGGAASHPMWSCLRIRAPALSTACV